MAFCSRSDNAIAEDHAQSGLNTTISPKPLRRRRRRYRRRRPLPEQQSQLFGPRTSADGALPPYGGSHQIITSIPEPSPKRAHTSVVGDLSTPVRGDVPAFRDVWRYLLGA